MSEESPVIPTTPVAVEKKPHGLKGRKPNDKQMENLRKGMEIMKAKREEQKKKKEEKKAKIKAGEVVEDSSEDEAPPPKKVEKPKKAVEILEAIPLAPPKTRKQRSDTGVPKVKGQSKYATRDDFESFKTSILDTIRSTPVIKEVEKSVPVERVVEKVKEVPIEKTKVLSGSELLNKIFFNV